MSTIPAASHFVKCVAIGLIKQEGADLTLRQIAVMTICYLEGGPHTVRGLAKRLGLPKPAITRAADRLEQFDLVARKPEPGDRRSIVLTRTKPGQSWMRALDRVMTAAAKTSAGQLTESES